MSIGIKGEQTKIKSELSVQPSDAGGRRHSGQAKRDPEFRVFNRFWIPAPAPDSDPEFAGMTK